MCRRGKHLPDLRSFSEDAADPLLVALSGSVGTVASSSVPLQCPLQAIHPSSGELGTHFESVLSPGVDTDGAGDLPPACGWWGLLPPWPWYVASGAGAARRRPHLPSGRVARPQLAPSSQVCVNWALRVERWPVGQLDHLRSLVACSPWGDWGDGLGWISSNRSSH